MVDFWLNSGFGLLERNSDGYLELSDDYLRAYLVRPELRPEEESCSGEIRLHQKLAETPRGSVTESEIQAIVDEDARQNFRYFLKFRSLLMAADSIEQCYLRIFGGDRSINIPPLFIDHLTHVILRNILSNVDDPFELRAAELLFRDQTLQVIDGALLLMDTEIVELKRGHRAGSPVNLVEILRTETVLGPTELEVLSDENLGKYHARSELFEFAFDVSPNRPGIAALCRVLQRWVAHFLGVPVTIEPRQQVDDEKWSWHLGLDVTSSALLNDLYNQVELGGDRLERLISLFSLTFDDPENVRADLSGRPVYMGLAVDADDRLRVKPQNLLANLPLAASA